MQTSTSKHYVLESEQEAKRLDFQAQNHNYDPSLEIQPDELELFDSQRIIDAGCGSGALFKLLLSYNKNLSIEAVDFSQTRINQLKSSFVSDKVRFHQENLTQLTFKDSVFDMAVCRFVYQHNPNNNQAITDEIYRILKPGGTFILIDADGILYNSETENKFLSECIEQIKSSFFNYDGYVCRKIPRYLKRAKFNLEKVKPVPIIFASSEDRKHEYELFKMRFEQIEPSLEPILGKSLERFKAEYLEEILNEESFLYYNKFVFFARK